MLVFVIWILCMAITPWMREPRILWVAPITVVCALFELASLSTRIARAERNFNDNFRGGLEEVLREKARRGRDE
jgi:hypothetical protein